MTFEFVLNNTDPLVFPDSVGLSDSVGLVDNLVYDPETGRLYDPQVETNENDYEYRWSQNRWVSHVDLSMRKLLDDNFVNVPGDIMTGGLQMGDSIEAVDHPMFIVKRYNLESLPWMTYDEITITKNHTLRCNEYIIGNRITVDQNTSAYHVKQPKYQTLWYKLKLDPTFEIIPPYRPVEPTESDWQNDAVFIGEGTNIVLYPDLIEGNSYVRSIQRVFETSPEVLVKPPYVESICDTPFISHQTTIPVTP
jgi:hypothetical protein